VIKVGEEGHFHGGAQSIALRVEGFAQSDALRSAPILNHTRTSTGTVLELAVAGGLRYKGF
jgi:hypothetical protein